MMKNYAMVFGSLWLSARNLFQGRAAAENYAVIFAAVGAAIVIVSSLFCIYQLYRLIVTDAACRGLKHPRLWGVIGVERSGILLYLIRRRKYPVIAMTEEQRDFIASCKKRTGVCLLFLVLGAILCVWDLVVLFPGL